MQFQLLTGMRRMRASTSSPSTSPKFSFSVLLLAQVIDAPPTAMLQPFVSVALLRKRNPPAARTANSLFAMASMLSVVDASPKTFAPVWPLVLAR
jgi:hypothetical protein